MSSNLTNHPLDPPHTRHMNKKFIWGLLISAAGIFSFVCVINWNSNPIEIQIMDLWKLIDQGPFQLNPKAAIEVREDSDGNELTYRYSQLDNLRIGPNEITGTVKRELIRPPSLRTKPENKVAFFTPRYGLENYSNAIFDLLIRKGFSNVRGEKAPSIWYNMLPMFVPLIPILLIVYYMMRQKGSGFTAAFSRSRGKLYARKDIRVTFQRRRGDRRSGGRTARSSRFSQIPKKISGPWRTNSQGRTIGRADGHRQDSAGQGHRRRGQCALFQPVRFRFRGNVRRRRSRTRTRHVQTSPSQGALHRVHRRIGFAWARCAETAWKALMTSENRRSTLCWWKWTALAPTTALLSWPPPTAPTCSTRPCFGPADSIATCLSIGPTCIGREKILQVHLQKVKIDKSVDIKWIAKITSGFVGADLANLVNEAALLAARANKSCITMHEFNEGVERLTSGLEKRQRVMGSRRKKTLCLSRECPCLGCFLPAQRRTGSQSIDYSPRISHSGQHASRWRSSSPDAEPTCFPASKSCWPGPWPRK